MKVLLAADGSDPAFRAARTLGSLIAGREADIRVLVVLSYSLYPYQQGGEPGEEAEAEKAASEAATATSEKAVLALKQAGHDAMVVRRFGHPTDEIIREIEDWDPDLIVLGRRGLRGAKAWVGSVSEHVLHHTQVPVLLVP